MEDRTSLARWDTRFSRSDAIEVVEMYSVNEPVRADSVPVEPLTEKQAELYDWIEGFMKARGMAPTIREMMKGLGRKSPAPIQARLNRMRAKGYIDWVDGMARTYQLLGSDTLDLSLPAEVAAIAYQVRRKNESLEELIERALKALPREVA